MSVTSIQPTDLRNRVLLAAERVFAEDGIHGAAIGRICELADLDSHQKILEEFGQAEDMKELLLRALIEQRLLLLNEVRWSIIDYWQAHYQVESYRRRGDGCLEFLADESPLRLGELLYTAFYPLCWYIFKTYPFNYWSTCLLQYNIHSPNAIFAQSSEPWFSSLLYCISFAEKKLTPLMDDDSEEAMERIYFAAHQLQSLFALQEAGLRDGKTPLEEARPLAQRVILAAGRQVAGDIAGLNEALQLPDAAQQAAIDNMLENRGFNIVLPRWNR